MTTPHSKKAMGRSPLRLGFLLIPLVLVCFGLSPAARAACKHDCLTNQNTVLGDDALFSLTSGVNNTAVGFEALFDNTIGAANTAVGYSALLHNDAGTTIPPLVPLRSLATQPEATTRLTALLHWKTTRLATSTRQ
jgi:hypothetical protein